MTISSEPWFHPRAENCKLHLDVVPIAMVHGLAASSPTALASELITPYLAGPECVGLWQMRSKQLIDRPMDAPWVTRLMVDPQVAQPVGLAGFHGAPDETGMVEIGYRVDPKMRRRGYARQSLETLLAVSRRCEDVRTVRATISPNNLFSMALISGFSFTEVGEQWDEDDGLEIIFELAVAVAT